MRSAAGTRARHPVAGFMTLTQQAFDVARTSEQTLIAMTAPPGSSSHHALELLRMSDVETGDAPQDPGSGQVGLSSYAAVDDTQ
ncbi:hypothetical protein [Nocardia sp. NPDC049707]|uniref:MmyB family transcriptional regulator n=1 Tax=Nocardia sp. NPDC049707 TaxID=3154735 RepID=UPI0034156979